MPLNETPHEKFLRTPLGANMINIPFVFCLASVSKFRFTGSKYAVKTSTLRI